MWRKSIRNAVIFIEIRRSIRENSRIDFLSLLPYLLKILRFQSLFSFFFFVLHLRFSKSRFILLPKYPPFSIYIVRPTRSKHRKSQTVGCCSNFYRIRMYNLFIFYRKYQNESTSALKIIWFYLIKRTLPSYDPYTSIYRKTNYIRETIKFLPQRISCTRTVYVQFAFIG